MEARPGEFVSGKIRCQPDANYAKGESDEVARYSLLILFLYQVWNKLFLPSLWDKVSTDAITDETNSFGMYEATRVT
jgi:hypothetical protein